MDRVPDANFWNQFCPSSIRKKNIPNTETRLVHRHGCDSYLSFNTLEAPCPPKCKEYSTSFPKEWIQEARWFDARYPFMAFALTRPSWKGSTFGRLKGDRHNFPVARGRDGWSLDSILQQDWWRLENVLKLVYESTFRLVPTAMHPLDFQVYRAPATWRYMQTHQSENLARIHVYNSRNAFVLLMALCSYAIAISEVQFYGTETTQSVPRWIQALVERENAPAVWTDELIQSELSLTNVARVGVYIDWSSFEYTNLIPCFVMLGVPVWIKLPSSSSIPQGPAIQLVKPEILEKSSQHFLQETPETFFSRIEKRRERFKMLENAKTRMIRVDRERRASSYQCPEHNAATLYEWREKDEAFIRIRITSLQKPVVWANYRNSQKHYDSISDEWDLCTLLDPDVHLDDGMDDAEGIYQVGEYANRTDATADILPDVDIPQALSYLVSNLKEQTSLRSMFHPSHETLEDKLFYRYGFHPDGSIYSPPQNCLSVHRVAKTLVEDELQLEEQSNKEVVVHFVTAYASQSASVPPSLHDLSEENVFSLKERMNQAFRVVKQEQGHYSISDGDIANLNISVLEASLAVEVLRLSMGSLCSVSQRFISRGTRFRINAGCGNPFPSNSTRGLGLGFRPHGYRPDRSDYQCYIKRRNELLSDLTIARAALFYGGIVWRLTVDAIVDVHGQIDFTHLLQADFDDIEITQNILSIIVGLYQIWSENGQVTSDSSWWPQSHQWHGSNLDIGYWSDGCEKWYLLRLRALERDDHNSTVRSGSEWRKALSFYKSTGKLRKNNEVASEEFLGTLDVGDMNTAI